MGSITFQPIGLPTLLEYSPIYKKPVNVTGFYDYETYNYRPDFDYNNLGFGYYVASDPDSPIPLAYIRHKGTDVQAEDGAMLFGFDNCVVTSVSLGAYNILEFQDSTYRYEYWHCQSIISSVGDTINKDTIVARQGSTGADNSHLHFVVYELSTGNIVDGLKIMAGEGGVIPPEPPIKKLDFQQVIDCGGCWL